MSNSPIILKSRNYFNDILYTKAPFSTGVLAFCLFFSIVLHLKKFVSISAPILLVFLLFFAWAIVEWCFEMTFEGRCAGRYTKKVRSALVCGFALFLISEVMLFGGFFWAYFDRVYSPGAIIGCQLPTGMEHIDYWRWPLLGTIVLVTSGYFANQAYYAIRGGSRSGLYVFGSLTLFLGFIFLFIQLLEYNGLDLRISDNVFGSFFFLLTGFHGFHVTVGIIFLFDQYSRFVAEDHNNKNTARLCIVDRSRHLGAACALIYWHFVDIIWLFLFFNVYVFHTTFDDWSDTFFDYEYAAKRVISFLESNDVELFFLLECSGLGFNYQDFKLY